MKRFLGMILAAVLFMVSTAMAESAVDVIMSTGTTQAFTDEAVPSEDLKTILRAGLSTESAINQQPWFFVAVTNPEIMKEIAGSGMNGFSAPADMGKKPEGFSGSKPEGAPSDLPGGAGEGSPAGERPAAPPTVGSGAKASLGDSPAAVIVYKNSSSKSPDASFDCGLATQNMVIAASSLGYGVKIVSSPTMTLNGENHDALCEKLGVDPSMQAVAVLLIGKADSGVDATSGATTREAFETKTSIIE